MITVAPGLTLRPLTPEDHARHFALMRRIYPPAFAYLWPDDGDWYLEHTHGREAFLHDLREVGTPYYQVLLENHPIGILRYRKTAPNPDFPGETALKLERIYLGPEARGRGVGTSLLNFVKQRATELGRQQVWLERMDTNAATIRFYYKNGFVDGGAFCLTYDRMYAHLRGMVRMSCRCAGKPAVNTP